MRRGDALSVQRGLCRACEFAGLNLCPRWTPDQRRATDSRPQKAIDAAGGPVARPICDTDIVALHGNILQRRPPPGLRFGVDRQRWHRARQSS